MLTSATITVDFLANYAGPHRACWRVQGSGNPYVCTNLVTCVGGGSPCQFLINVMVDLESCEDVIFEGYIQATCQPEGSSIDQVPFEVTYTPTPSCNMYSLTNDTGSTYNFTSSELGVNCDGTARPALSVADGASIALCGIAGMPQIIIDDFNVVPLLNSCCSTCQNYSFTISIFNDKCAPNILITYTNPITGILIIYPIALPPYVPGTTTVIPVSINAALGSLNIYNGNPCAVITNPVVTDCVVV